MGDLMNRFAGEKGRRRLVDALRQQALIGDDHRLASEIAAVAELQEVSAGTVLIEEGAPDDDLFLIVVGELKVTVGGRVVAQRGSGEAVGEMAALDPTAKRSAGVVAVGEVLVARVPEAEFARIAARHPDVWRRLALTLGNRIRQGAAASASEPEDNELRRAGDYWTIVYEGHSISVRDAKGIRYLARLLAEPGREVHVLDLLAADAEEGQVIDVGDAGEMLDERARVQYRDRLADLEEELASARDANDVGRTAAIQRELDAIAERLSAAFGLGGRARKGGQAAERARKAVRSCVAEAIRRIDEHHPGLAAHLRNAVRLGGFCAYRPEKPTSWVL